MGQVPRGLLAGRGGGAVSAPAWFSRQSFAGRLPAPQEEAPAGEPAPRYVLMFDRWDELANEWRTFGQTENGEVEEVERA